ncbi:MAG: cytochrome b N-terminal domain-containing protein [Acidimicrobiia bacterium]|jgi:quinol-cytochrome oxidoreductase complex cytochrome b subunit|nr:cytochrome b N-terminal domain-containing protein [Acidimicrobiia bacterium]
MHEPIDQETRPPESWLDERTGSRGIYEAIFLRKIPKVNWAFTLGSATLFVVVNQFVTGILLTVYYVPSVQDAYETVNYIDNTLPMGWLVRGLHHWGATAMVALVILHMLRVIIHGAYKYPREITWLTGVALLLLTFAFGFTGYLLPWDQKAYWATTVGTRILEVVPFVGDWLLRIARGGDDLSAVTLSRFFGIHVWILPALLLLLVAVHLFLVIRIGISAPPKRDD